MVTINELIQQAANPFDPVTFKTGNFWQEENQVAAVTVASIHQEEIQQIIQVLDQISKDHKTRAVLLTGDPGSGKSYVLKRLKQSLNQKAFFVYIPPFVDSDFIWRHTLRQTVDSLMHNPEGQEESQLILWFKSLSVSGHNTLLKLLLGKRNLFVKNLTEAYPSGIYQAKEFFGVLYDLTNPKLYFTACSWLRGDDLDDDDLKMLKVKKSIDSEAEAQSILSNLGKIATSTLPIVLCFDQVESKQLPDGSADIQPVFTVNTTFHNEMLKNFLIIISIVTNTWKQNSHRIQQSDKARIEEAVELKPISLKQGEELWASRLSPLHAQAVPKPKSNIYPLTRNALVNKFPGGKTTPRNVLFLGQQIFLHYKLENHLPPGIQPTVETDPLASFKLLWEKEFSRTEQKVTRIRHFSEPELISMLMRAFAALQVQEIRPKLISSPTYASYSFSYHDSKHGKKTGLVWAENPPTSFFHIMNACFKVAEKHECQAIYLIRAESPGKAVNKGYKIYKTVFIDSPDNRHIKPDLESVHYLATYDRLVNSVHAHEVVISNKTVTLNELQNFLRDSQILHHCHILQDLSIVPNAIVPPHLKPEKEKDFLLSFIKVQHLIARKVVVQNTISQFPKLNDAQIQQLIQELCQEKQIMILDGSAPLEEQIICIVPN